MAVAFNAVGARAQSANTVANPTALAPALPTRSTGDLLVIVTTCVSIVATVATPTNWTVWPGFPRRSATASGGSFYVFYRASDGTEVAPTVTWSGIGTVGTSGDSSQAIIASFTGANVTSPSDQTVPAATDASAANPSIPTITTVTAGSLVYGLAMKVSDTAQTGTIANSFTEVSDNHTTTGIGHLQYTAQRVLGSAGATGASVVTASNATAARCLSLPIAIKAAVPTITSVARVSLESEPTPATRTAHTVKARVRKTSGAGLVLFNAAVYEGATNRSGDIASGALTTTLADVTLSIPDASAANITDYSNLELRFWGTSSTGDVTNIELANIYLETPVGVLAAAPQVTMAPYVGAY